MANDLFAAGNVMRVSVDDLRQAQQNLQRIDAQTDPSRGLRSVMRLAAAMVHRYLLGLGRDRPPVGTTGVLPVITGRLKNSFFWQVEGRGNDLTGAVVSNVDYGAEVEGRRGFLARTVRDQEQPVNDLFAQYVRGVVR